MENEDKKIEEESLKLEKGSDEWREACGSKNRNNGFAIKNGKYVVKPEICSEECKLATKGCRFFESCYGKECILREIEQKEIEDIRKTKLELLTAKINKATKLLELKEDIDTLEGVFYLGDSANETNNILSWLDKLEKIKDDK